jgi:hypothetical protein
MWVNKEGKLEKSQLLDVGWGIKFRTRFHVSLTVSDSFRNGQRSN